MKEKKYNIENLFKKMIIKIDDQLEKDISPNQLATLGRLLIALNKNELSQKEAANGNSKFYAELMGFNE